MNWIFLGIFEDLQSFINSEIRRGDELKKHNLIYNGVTQLFVKLCFEIFGLREFQSSLSFCTSSVPNEERPKAQLKERTVDKDFKLKHRQ